jgi:hypothetical protein
MLRLFPEHGALMSWVACHGFGRCGNRIRTGQKGFDGWCSRCRRRHNSKSTGRRPDGCYLCTKPKLLGFMCQRCARAYDRWLASPSNRGDTDSLLRWVAARVRRFVTITLPDA